ncbi:3'(2'),5'-bisphosphate nucleotidase [Lachnellula subtilissima]|uniref:3'(2'),5'-bisphosphate nucleotidase n=1 Tax=Lachnellula subtilissima TaxID=602034 RepID=A0A8H8RFR2_9HELO|nr:3'(2'),5'-bisphosphate nucleotidase [Lachnellula subtilissima]
MDLPYSKERLIAELAVQRAALLTKKVLREIDKGTISKSDKSPVTIADFAAQALLICAIHHNFPDDKFVGEEAADTLREDVELQKRVWDLVSAKYLDDRETNALLSTPVSSEEMLNIIDLGCGPGGRKGRVWMLDPVDGTAAFMRGQQYAVSLALVEDGQEVVGVVGCPNLNLENGKIHEDRVDREGYGMMLSAVRGQGAFIRRISSGESEAARRIERPVNGADVKDLHWVEGTTSRSNDIDKQWKLAKSLGISFPGTDLYSSQMRYIALAVGGGDINVTIPKKRDKISWVWDHAGGHLILKESGGLVTDLNGKEFDFGAGRYLGENYGRIVAPMKIRKEIMATVVQFLAE